MKPCFRQFSAPLAALALFAAAGPAYAQECVGLPGGRGILSLGVEGTDGATGRGVAFAYQTEGASVQLQHRSLDAFAQQDEISETEVQGAMRLGRFGLPLCLTAGVQLADYEYSEHAGSGTGQDGIYTDSYRIIGGYERVRVPVGISLGREFSVGRGVSLVPYLQPTVVWESERMTSVGNVARTGTGGSVTETRNGLGWGVNTGVAVARDWLVVRANLSHTNTVDRALSTRYNRPGVSLHLGVRF
ncbi:hypothetical protein [Longimicrobium sp.]|uniref:hypothetical protein n=1 Tax=Longimicrobium sp. TaxID=2029185 RepID=UPI003B3A7E3F